MKQTILVVDDDPQYREMIVDVLETAEYQIQQGKDGEDAFNIIESNKGKIDLLLTDIVMPRMDGVTLVEKIQAKYPQVKVIYSSGFSQSESFHERATMGSVNFIEKPFMPDDLINLVAKVLASP